MLVKDNQVVQTKQLLPPTPEPVPDWNTYERERELCLSLDPQRKRNYEHYLNSQRRGPSVDYFPIKLDIENVSRCNFRCIMCQVSDWENGRRSRDMTFDEFKKIIDEQYGLVEIKLQGMGEPMIQGEPFFDMVRYARSKHIWVRSVTNASLLHLKDNYQKVIDSDINELMISIDGADKETFEEIRRGSVFEKVVENCKLINAYCREKDVHRTKMWVVVQNGNRHQLDALVDLAHDMDFQSLVFSLDLTDWGDKAWADHNHAISVDDTLDTESAWKLVEKGMALGIKVAFWYIKSKYDTDTPKNLCPWPFERAYISSDLKVVPCCMIANPDSFEIPGGHEESFSFSDVWKGGSYEKFRKAHLSGKIPGVCKMCYR